MAKNTEKLASGVVVQPKLVTKAEFKKMSKSKRRVLVAKDVIASLDAKRIVATRGSFFEVSADVDGLARMKFDKLGIDETSVVHDARTVLSAIKQCHVCARGALVVAAIERFDNINAEGDPVDGVRWRAGDSEAISNIFGEETMYRLEEGI